MPILLLKANIRTVITLLNLFLYVRKLSLSIFLLEYREIFNFDGSNIVMATRIHLRREGSRHLTQNSPKQNLN